MSGNSVLGDVGAAAGAMATAGRCRPPHCLRTVRQALMVATYFGALLALECSSQSTEAGRATWASELGGGRNITAGKQAGKRLTDPDAHLDDWSGRPSSCDSPVPHTPFYIYSLPPFASCFPANEREHAEQRKKINLKTVEWKQNAGASLFFLQQIEDHPWRTTRPEEADLFIIPPVLDLAGGNACLGSMTLRTAQKVLVKELEASPWFQRRQGRDHLLIFHHWSVRKELFPRSHKEGQNFQWSLKDLSRNMIFAFRYHKRSLTFDVPERWIPNMVNTVVFPHLSPVGLTNCTVVTRVPPQAGDMSSRLSCQYQAQAEDTFEKFLANRPINLFFAATVGRSAQGKDLRRIAVSMLGDVHRPNYISNTKKSRISNQKFAQYMRSSKLSLHIRGHDAASSRILDAWAMGTPQIFLARRFFKDVAPFKCRIPWDKVVLPINEHRFKMAPVETVTAAMDNLVLNDYAGLRKLWQLQREAAKEVLWHVPGSRVGLNLLQDVMRTLHARGL